MESWGKLGNFNIFITAETMNNTLPKWATLSKFNFR